MTDKPSIRVILPKGGNPISDVKLILVTPDGQEVDLVHLGIVTKIGLDVTTSEYPHFDIEILPPEADFSVDVMRLNAGMGTIDPEVVQRLEAWCDAARKALEMDPRS